MSKNQEIVYILENSLTNLGINSPLPMDALEAGSDDTLDLIAEHDPMTADLMRAFRDEKMTSTDDDFPFDEEQCNYLMREWLEACLNIVKSYL